MTHRGRVALALGGATYLAAWAFGSKRALPGGARAACSPCARAGSGCGWRTGRSQLRRHGAAGERGRGRRREGAARARLEARRCCRPTLVVTRADRPARRARDAAAPRTGAARGLRARAGPARALRVRGRPRATIEDPFGLERVERRARGAGRAARLPAPRRARPALLRSGAHAHDGRRLLLQRPPGFDLHSVREYEQGESLRKVHWRSTARRGQLMVKELEDAPRDEVAVVLDADAARRRRRRASTCRCGRPARSCSRTRRGRRAVLVDQLGGRESQRVHRSRATGGEALELLAGAEPDGGAPAGSAARGRGRRSRRAASSSRS